MACVLVIAGTSFVGRAVCAELASQGWRVVATARRDTVLERCDVTDAARVAAVIGRHRPDAIVQCAGVTDGGPGELYAAHVGGSLNVLEAVRELVPAAPVVLIGSAAEYGPVPADALPVSEAHPPRPATFYGSSKLAQTQLGQVAASAWGLRVRTARLFNVIGPGLPRQYFLAAVAERLRGLRPGDPFAVHNLGATRDFVDVRDAAAGIAALTGPDVPDGVYNVASGEETPLGEVAAYLGELAGGLVPVEAGAGEQRVQTTRSRGDAARLRALGWRPRHGWRESVADFWRTISTTTSA